MSRASSRLAAASESYVTLKQRLVDQYVRQAWAVWNTLTPSDWWNDAVTVGVAMRLGWLEVSMISQVERLAVSYADETLRLAGITPEQSALSLILPRYGTTPFEVAHRTADEYRHEAVQYPNLRPVSFPEPDDESYEIIEKWRQAAYERMSTVVETDATLAGNITTLDRYADNDVTYYRRIIHPELSRSGTCGLCVAAADRWYRRKNLIPIHPHCHCTVAVAGDKSDVGFELTSKDLSRLYSEAGGTSGRKLSKVRVMSVNHGELGPILTDKEARAQSNENWQRPTASYTVDTLKRMRDNARKFDAEYQNLATMKRGETLSFRYDGKTYRFVNNGSANIARARAMQRRTLERVQAMLDNM